ncbi:MAG TPA: ATP synthase F1 subunit epsilon [Acidimicrobiales bacterium]|jgi:F-type H+-transporting ATPase subunit epsilon|nr:ATP synthase F1 subunit epsilon [Acidimicrobiales bacterium]
MPLHVELVSPERILYSGEAEMVIARTAGGDIAFLTGHAPFLGALGVGAVRIQRVGGGEEQAAVHGGFVEVKDDRVIVLSDVAELAGQIDVERARRAEEEAKRRLHAGGEADPEVELALRRAQVRLTVALAAPVR